MYNTFGNVLMSSCLTQCFIANEMRETGMYEIKRSLTSRGLRTNFFAVYVFSIAMLLILLAFSLYRVVMVSNDIKTANTLFNNYMSLAQDYSSNKEVQLLSADYVNVINGEVEYINKIRNDFLCQTLIVASVIILTTVVYVLLSIKIPQRSL